MEAEEEFDFEDIDDEPYQVDDDNDLQMQLQEMLVTGCEQAPSISYNLHQPPIISPSLLQS